MASTTLIVHPVNASSPLWIVRPLRDCGKPIPRFVWASGEGAPRIAMLSIDWEDSDVHRRRMRLARFSADATDLLPPLRDVRVVRMQGGDLTLSGFEQLGDREYAQAWFCRLAREEWQARGKPEGEQFAHLKD